MLKIADLGSGTGCEGGGDRHGSEEEENGAGKHGVIEIVLT